MTKCGRTALALALWAGTVFVPLGPGAGAKPADGEHKLVFILLDGTNERVFRRLLEQGDLPFMGALLAPGEDGRRRGIYTAATTIWPTTTGPAYAPFVAGLYPKKSHLSGIRQFNRERNELRVYQLEDLRDLGQDFNRRYPTIYEVLGRGDTFNQQGWLTRRGWDQGSGKAFRPLHENFSSGLAVSQTLMGRLPTGDRFKAAQEVDRSNAISFINYVTPFFDGRARSVFREFEGRELSWGGSAARQILKEGAFSLLGLERVVREKSFASLRLSRLPRFSFISFHLPDDTSHGLGPGTEENPSEYYQRALRTVDEIIGAMIEVFKAHDEFDDLTLMISSDHGTSMVKSEARYHSDIITKLSEATGVPIKQPARRRAGGFNRAWKDRGEHQEYAGVAAVSGNANVQLYFRKPGSTDWKARPSYEELRAYSFPSDAAPVDLIATLTGFEAISHVFAVDRTGGEYHIFGSSGQAVIGTRAAEDGAVLYSYSIVSGVDPLGYREDPAPGSLIGLGTFHSGNEWAAATRDSQFPDGVVQIVQLLDAPNSGDLILDAAPFFEPWDEQQLGLHGALRREHIAVPLFIYSPELEDTKARALFEQGRLPRTVDVYPTILALLGERPPAAIEWEYRRFVVGPLQTDSAPVESDIDGEALDIWR